MSLWSDLFSRMRGLFPDGRTERSMMEEDIEIPERIAELTRDAERRLGAGGRVLGVEEPEKLPSRGPSPLSLALGLDGQEDKEVEEDGTGRLEEDRD